MTQTLTINEAFGQRVRELRLQAKMSQGLASYEAKLGTGSLSAIERGKYGASEDVVRRLATALKADESELLQLAGHGAAEDGAGMAKAAPTATGAAPPIIETRQPEPARLPGDVESALLRRPSLLDLVRCAAQFDEPGLLEVLAHLQERLAQRQEGSSGQGRVEGSADPEADAEPGAAATSAAAEASKRTTPGEGLRFDVEKALAGLDVSQGTLFDVRSELEMERYVEELEAYFNRRAQPEAFLRAVLSNDLLGVVGRMDVARDFYVLVVLVQMMLDQAPEHLWGSREIVSLHLEGLT